MITRQWRFNSHRKSDINADRLVRNTSFLMAATGTMALLGFGFGPSYAEQGHHLLQILAIGAVAVALNTWTSSVLKLMGLMKSSVVSSAVFAITTIGLVQLWGTRGLEWFGWAWLIGNLAASLYAVAALVVHHRNSAKRSTTSGLGELSRAHTGPTEVCSEEDAQPCTGVLAGGRLE